MPIACIIAMQVSRLRLSYCSSFAFLLVVLAAVVFAAGFFAAVFLAAGLLAVDFPAAGAFALAVLAAGFLAAGFSSFTSPAKRPPERYRVRLDGGEYSPPEPGLSCCVSSPPPGGDAVGGGGGTFTPYGVPLPIPGQGRGKVGPLSGPIVAQMGYNRRSRRPR